MRPLAVLIGIVMGSAVSLTVGLALTWVVLLFLPEHAEAFAAERAPLAQAIALFGLLALASAASFYGEIRQRAWRGAAFGSLVLLLAATIAVYWPR